jgi:hypothetical protein
MILKSDKKERDLISFKQWVLLQRTGPMQNKESLTIFYMNTHILTIQVFSLIFEYL